MVFENFTDVLHGCGSRVEGESPLALITRLSKKNVLVYKINVMSNARIKV